MCGQCCQHGGGRCHCGQLGDAVEDTGRQTKPPLDLFTHLSRGLGSEGAGAHPADLFQQQQKRPECVSGVSANVLYASSG